MRLIRLTTTDPACVFDNYFNTDILIPPQSKIALQNLSFELRSGFLTIAAENASIVYTAANGINKTATLQHKSYTINLVNILLDDIRVALNNSLSVVTGSLGMEWFADAVNDKVHLLQKQLYFDEQLTTVRTIEVAQSAPGSANGYKVYKGNNTVTENNQYIHWQTEWSKGCPKFSTKVIRNDHNWIRNCSEMEDAWIWYMSCVRACVRACKRPPPFHTMSKWEMPAGNHS